MPDQDLHVLKNDGTVDHELFTRESWNRRIKEPQTQEMWTHRPGVCRHPAAHLFVARRDPAQPVTQAERSEHEREVELQKKLRHVSAQPGLFEEL